MTSKSGHDWNYNLRPRRNHVNKKAKIECEVDSTEFQEGQKTELNKVSTTEDLRTMGRLNPLLMEDIMDLIVRFLDVNSLQNVRQVCKVWNNQASKQLFNVSLFSVPNGFHDSLSSKKRNEKMAMKLFLSSRNIKIKNLFIKGQQDVPILRSLNILGSKSPVNTLKFDFNQAHQYKNVLKKEIPNVTDLNHLIHRFPYYEPSVLEIFLSLNRPLTISALGFEPFDFEFENHLDIYEKFSKGKIKVKNLFINLFLSQTAHQYSLPQISRQLCAILMESRDTIQSLRILSAIGCLEELKIPMLPKLHSLECHAIVSSTYAVMDVYHQGKLLPNGFTFANSLPNINFLGLSTFKIGQWNHGESFDLWGKSFMATGKALGVKHVLYDDSFGFSTESLKDTFPNAIIIKM